ncbi:putative carboxypeptidase [Escovopsis weberi]|uniref:Putative carboxypeptidase n=1 Tax=Escovopsis weberi TaxID=150374 RepID=A0A0M8N199_ESCWE|nr:putative carboxypeptidase [Escovopsis weberi]
MLLTKPAMLLAGATSVSAFVAASIERGQQQQQQQQLSVDPTDHGFRCDLPPVLDPAGDGLPSALGLFSSREALERQVKRHQAVVRVPTVSYDDLGSFDEDRRWEPYYELHDVLKKTYPVTHKRAKVEKINTFGLLYTIQGSDETLEPVLLLAHQDVVPVADESSWKYPPFEAVYDGTSIWGRGSSDDKNSLTAILSALEALLSHEHYRPRRTVLLALGFDEERSGYLGAEKIAQTLAERYGEDGVAAVLDEGGLGLRAFGDVLYALPAVTEKSYMDVWVELDVVGGHSSRPFPHTGIGIMAEIVAALEAHPYQPRIVEDSPVHRHLQCQARYSPHAQPALTRRIRMHDLEGAADLLVQDSLAAQYQVQTSQAVDYISGGQKINAMPEKVLLGVNYRVSHHDSVFQVQHNVVEHARAVARKYGLSVRAYEGDDDYARWAAGHAAAGEEAQNSRPDIDYRGTLIFTTQQRSERVPVTPTSGPVWDIVTGTIRHTFASDNGTVVPSPDIMTGNTDSRHYLRLSKHVYRFAPYRYAGEDNIHTIDEHVRMDGHMEMVRFYYDFVRNFDAANV